MEKNYRHGKHMRMKARWFGFRTAVRLRSLSTRNQALAQIIWLRSIPIGSVSEILRVKLRFGMKDRDWNSSDAHPLKLILWERTNNSQASVNLISVSLDGSAQPHM